MLDIWKQLLENDLKKKKDISLHRELRIVEESSDREIVIDGKRLLNFASNDYLGLLNDRRVVDEGCRWAKNYGAGSGASRLITGTSKTCREVESEFAAFVGKEDALLYSSGYHANIGVLSAFGSRDTVIFCDKLNHASIYDGMQLSRAKIVRFRHNDVGHLEELLEQHKDSTRKIIVVDAVFSMEGDRSQLFAIVRLAHKYGCLTVVDEAHSFGVFGENGQGLVYEEGLVDKIDIIIGTFGKGFGSFGAIVLSDFLVADFLINNSRSFIFTTALPPFVVGAIARARRVIMEERRGKVLLERADSMRKRFCDCGIAVGDSTTQIIPVIVGSNDRALSLMGFLKEHGVFAPAIRPPTVPVGQSRIRLSLSFSHNEEDIENVTGLIKKWHENNGTHI